MKKIIVASLIVLIASSSFALAKEEKNPFDLIWEAVNSLQSRFDGLEESMSDSGAKKVQYSVSIPDDVSDADMILKNGELDEFYLKLSIPEISSDNLPQINLYTKGEDGLWKMGNTDYIRIDDGQILIKFAEEYYEETSPTSISLKDEPIPITSEQMIRFNMTGEHKLVVVY